MEASYGQWLAGICGNVQQLADAGIPEGAFRVLGEKVKPHYVALGEIARIACHSTSKLVEAERQSASDQFAFSRWIMFLLVALGVAVTAVALGIVRGANRTLRQSATELLEGSRQVAAAAGQVASASQSLAQGTSEQAATLEETSSSTTEITAITRRNAENTRTVRD